MQALDERKMKILQAIIRNYLETGEPVGSRTISKYTDLNLSSATIRNEMADLEELGYIVQPHTSAGRIPSDKGYRLYVDQTIFFCVICQAALPGRPFDIRILYMKVLRISHMVKKQLSHCGGGGNVI